MDYEIADSCLSYTFVQMNTSAAFSFLLAEESLHKRYIYYP